MLPVEDVQALAEELLRRRGSDPPVLFLGAGCARAAGVPSLEQMAFQVFADFYERDPSLVAQYVSLDYWDWLRAQPEGKREYEPLREGFFALMAGMSGIGRSKVLKRFYSRIPVPRFYQDLARLLRDGYFATVLTTSIDTLLEEALNGMGLQAVRDYAVIIAGGDESRLKRMRGRYDTEAATTIVKLHGDLAGRDVALSPEEIENALRAQQAFVKGELSGEMVVVGYDFESEPVNRWLRWTWGQMWWVNPDQPNGEHRERLEEKRSVRYIDGPGARPDEFFGVLKTVIQSMTPTWDEIDAWEVAEGEDSAKWAFSPGEELPVDLTAPSQEPPSPDELEVQYLRDQLESSQIMLSRLEQQAAVKGRSDIAVGVQIDYQRQQIAELEDRLRELSTPGSQVVELIRKIANSVARAGADPGAVTFLRKQANTVKAEYAREQPNQDVVSAAIGASVFLADRLGPERVDQRAVQDLAAIAPSAVTRGG